MFKVRIASNTFEDTFVSYVKRLGKGSFGLTSEPFKKISYKDAPSQNPGRIYYQAICEKNPSKNAETYILLEFDENAGREGLGAVFVTCGYDVYGEKETHGSRRPQYIDFVSDYEPLEFDEFKEYIEDYVKENYTSLKEKNLAKKNLANKISSRKRIEKITSRSSKKKLAYNAEEIYSRFREYCEQLPPGFVPEFPNQVKEYGLNHPSSMVIGYQGLREKNRKYSVYYRICLDKTANECYIYSTVMRTNSDIDLEDSEGVYSFWFTENNGEPISYPKFENRVAQGLVETWMPLPRESEDVGEDY